MCQSQGIINLHFIDGAVIELSLEQLSLQYSQHLIQWLNSHTALIAMPFDRSSSLKRRLRIFERDAWRCDYCTGLVDLQNGTLDHKVPISENITTACSRCNTEKDQMSYADYKAIWTQRFAAERGEQL